MNIGDVVSYTGDYGESKIAKISAVGSDKDSYEDVKLENGVFLTYSKKLKKYVPFKEKSLSSVYLEITKPKGSFDYILPSEVVSNV